MRIHFTPISGSEPAPGDTDMLDYGLTEEQVFIRDCAREIAEKKIRPVAAGIRPRGDLPVGHREGAGGGGYVRRLHR